MRKVRILLYHRVEYLCDDYNMLAVTPNNFEKHMNYLSEHYDVINLSEPMEVWLGGGERDAVIITFDDGYYDFLYNAVPILEKYHFPATIFISTGNIDSDCENWTDCILRTIFSNHKHNDFFSFENEFYCGKYPTRNYQEKYDFYQFVRRIFLMSSAEKRKKYEDILMEWSGSMHGRDNRRIMTSSEIRKLAKISGISIGAHTVTHAALKYLSIDEQKVEIQESKRVLEEIIGEKVKLFSYPFGTREEYSDITVDLLKEAGFEKAVTAYPGNITEKSDIYKLSRFTVCNYDEDSFANYIDYCVFNKKKKEKYDKNDNSNLPIEYIGKLENDWIIKNKEVSIVIWGTGYWGRELYSELILSEVNGQVVAFGDNNVERCGENVDNMVIVPLKEVKEMQVRNGCHILVKGKYDFEICRQLIQEGLKHIHLIQM